VVATVVVPFVLCSGWLSSWFSTFDSSVIASLSPPIIAHVIAGSGWAFPCFSYIVPQMSGSDEFFYFVSQSVTLIGGVAILAMVVTIFA